MIVKSGLTFTYKNRGQFLKFIEKKVSSLTLVLPVQQQNIMLMFGYQLPTVCTEEKKRSANQCSYRKNGGPVPVLFF